LTLYLRDGRRLGYARYGAADGAPLLYCHGFPGCRLEAALTHAVAARLGIAVVAPDRPGYGLSDPRPGSRIVDWPDDVAQLCDALGLARFGVIGVSGGAPYAVVCAARLAKRVTRLSLVGGLSTITDERALTGMALPARMLLSGMGRHPRWVLPLWSALHTLFRYAPAASMTFIARGLPPADRETLGRRVVFDALVASLREGTRAGCVGSRADLIAYTRDWPIEPSALSVPCDVWHGEEDATVPVSMGRTLVGAIGGARGHFLAGEGHYSLPVRHMAEILADFAEPDAG